MHPFKYAVSESNRVKHWEFLLLICCQGEIEDSELAYSKSISRIIMLYGSH